MIIQRDFMTIISLLYYKEDLSPLLFIYYQHGHIDSLFKTKLITIAIHFDAQVAQYLVPESPLRF